MGDRSEAISGWQCCYSQLFPPHIAHYLDEAPAPQWCKHSRPGAQQGADDTINEQTWLRAIQSLDGFSVLMFNPSNAT